MRLIHAPSTCAKLYHRASSSLKREHGISIGTSDEKPLFAKVAV